MTGRWKMWKIILKNIIFLIIFYTTKAIRVSGVNHAQELLSKERTFAQAAGGGKMREPKSAGAMLSRQRDGELSMLILIKQSVVATTPNIIKHQQY